jgi:hypothetical protein
MPRPLQLFMAGQRAELPTWVVSMTKIYFDFETIESFDIWIMARYKSDACKVNEG